MKKNVRKYNRSGIAVCPICSIQTRLEQHHINGRKIDRANEAWNLVNICPTCHAHHHDGDISIKGWIQTTTGRELEIILNTFSNN